MNGLGQPVGVERQVDRYSETKAGDKGKRICTRSIRINDKSGDVWRGAP